MFYICMLKLDMTYYVSVAQVNPVAHFGTLPQLFECKTNRFRTQSVKKAQELTRKQRQTQKAFKREKKEFEAEFEARMHRDAKLREVEQELFIQKSLMVKIPSIFDFFPPPHFHYIT